MDEIISHHEEGEKMFEGGSVGSIIFQGWTRDGELEKPRKSNGLNRKCQAREDRVSKREECYRKGQEHNVFIAFGKNTVMRD